MNDVLIPFAKHKTSGAILSVDEVRSGLSCDCQCIFCEVDMVAKKGSIQTHHFAHKSKDHDEDLVCHYSLERAIFWAIRETLSNQSHINVPECELEFAPNDLPKTFTSKVFDSHPVSYTEVSFPYNKEQSLHDLAIFKTSDDANLIIISSFMPSAIDLDQLLSFCDNRTPILILDLRELLQTFKRLHKGFGQTLSEYLINQHHSKHWHYHPKMMEGQADIEKQIEQYKQTFSSASPIISSQSPSTAIASNPSTSSDYAQKEISLDAIAQRLNELVSNAHHMKNKGLETAFKCASCHFISEYSNSNICPHCNSHTLEIIELTDFYFQSIESKYRSWNYPKQSLFYLP